MFEMPLDDLRLGRSALTEGEGMFARTAPQWLILLSLLLSSACVLSEDEVGFGRPRGFAPGVEEVGAESGWSQLSAATGVRGRVPSGEAGVPVVVVEEAGELMRGDFSCVGERLPAEAQGATRRVTGRTVYFGTEVFAPGTSVTFLDGEGSELVEVISDDRGEFSALVPDRSAAVVVWRPGFVPVRYDSTHPEQSFGERVELGAVKPSDIVLIEAAAGIHVETGRGSIVVRTFDCAGDNEAAGVRLAIEGAPTEIYYASSRFELSLELDRTTESGHAYLFNLAPGTYTIAAWGQVYPGAEGAVLLNRAVVEVGADALTVLDVHPE
jgi:hypothetical protein